MKYDTLNARSETIAKLDSYRLLWCHRQFCLVPMQNFIEPNYESGKSQWWQIERRDGEAMAIAGLYPPLHLTLTPNTVIKKKPIQFSQYLTA